MAALVGRDSLQWDNPHHESNSTMLGPHGPRSHRVIASAQGVPFEVGEGVETRRAESHEGEGEGDGDGEGDISIEGRTSEDKLIQTAKYPSQRHRIPFIHNLCWRQSKPSNVSSSRC